MAIEVRFAPTPVIKNTNMEPSNHLGASQNTQKEKTEQGKPEKPAMEKKSMMCGLKQKGIDGYILELKLHIADDYNEVRQSPLKWRISQYYSPTLPTIKEEAEEDYEPQWFYEI